MRSIRRKARALVSGHKRPLKCERAHLIESSIRSTKSAKHFRLLFNPLALVTDSMACLCFFVGSTPLRATPMYNFSKGDSLTNHGGEQADFQLMPLGRRAKSNSSILPCFTTSSRKVVNTPSRSATPTEGSATSLPLNALDSDIGLGDRSFKNCSSRNTGQTCTHRFRLLLCACTHTHKVANPASLASQSSYIFHICERSCRCVASLSHKSLSAFCSTLSNGQLRLLSLSQMVKSLLLRLLRHS